MNVLFVSQCEKRAINQTRRVLDQFAERSGVRTWATVITKAGLDTVRKLLKQAARKNTAVACHWIHSHGEFELLWIVGNARQFDARGRVPTNLSSRNIRRADDENDWHSLRVIELMARLAALFHDFGKANAQFQGKLRDRQIKDRFRHEWVSLRLFEAFICGARSDADWLQRLAQLSDRPESTWLNTLQMDDYGATKARPLAQMPPFARAIGWLILSHHQLPDPGRDNAIGDLQLIQELIDVSWTRVHADVDAKACWEFPMGTPDQSLTWRARAATTAKRVLKVLPALRERDWSLDPHAMHLARMGLILGDHHYSSKPADRTIQDASYLAHANTDRDSGALKQRLDEHLIGVERVSGKIIRTLPRLARDLPRLARHRGLTKPTTHPRFRWQNRAFELAESRRRESERCGFFGVNMASTGCGKTLANARIMYGLANPSLGARFSIALGLRTLTLQTGTALRERMHLGDDDMAVLVGSAAVRALYAQALDERQAQQSSPLGSQSPGSASADPLVPDDAHVVYEGAISEPNLKAWLDGARGNSNKLVQAPILVSTIDHLIQASESTRGGHQLAPMLRLLTADLVLDEPDDFDLADLPALTRLVYMAALLGARVLLSSATLAPAIVQGLYEAYRAGRAGYQQHRGEPGLPVNVCCAWFDEFDCATQPCATEQEFAVAHDQFVGKRLRKLATQPVRRLSSIAPINLGPLRKTELHKQASKTVALTLWTQAMALHRQHATEYDGRRISIGLARMANIDPIIDVADLLLRKIQAPTAMQVHLCVYHSRFPLLMRAAIEAVLDRALSRAHPPGTPDPFVLDSAVQRAIAAAPEATEHLFLVLASPVAEVGRDHDYDWAIVEPSSMRSIIQLAGRVRRHREDAVATPNIALLNRNHRSLRGKTPCFVRPGFESERGLRLHSQALDEILQASEYEQVSAAPRIRARDQLQPTQNLVDLEHARLATLMLEKTADLASNVRRYWQSPVWLTAITQREERFRRSRASMTYYLAPDADSQGQAFMRFEDKGQPDSRHEIPTVLAANSTSVRIWPLIDYASALDELSDKRDLEPAACARSFGTLELEVDGETHGHLDWEDHGPLGIRRKRQDH